jgi:hypothetical protein
LDSKLSTGAGHEEDSNSIFESRKDIQQKKNAYAEEIEKKKLAENERLKGNEFMQSKEY